MKQWVLASFMNDSLGLYLSIPFCRGKCTFCNFASDAFDPRRLPSYVEAICREIAAAPSRAVQIGAVLPAVADSVYLGGGTPSLLAPEQIKRIFSTLRASFRLSAEAEITVECAPGQLAADALAALQAEGANRISFGVQSFNDREAAAVGRRHTGVICRQEIDRVLQAGIAHVGVDLIAGLPNQTPASWEDSLAQTLASGADHASVYLFEIDEDSRLGREVLEGGQRLGAATVPEDDLTASFYEDACARFADGSLLQYEISNFARVGCQSRHNLKYWRRQPYLGFGLDAHSMLRSSDGAALRFSNTDQLDIYTAAAIVPPPAVAGGLTLLPQLPETPTPQRISVTEAVEETLFLGLRQTAGLDLDHISDPQAQDPAFLQSLASLLPVLDSGCTEGLLAREGSRLWLTPRGRLLSNELFNQLLLSPVAA